MCKSKFDIIGIHYTEAAKAEYILSTNQATVLPMIECARGGGAGSVGSEVAYYVMLGF